MYCVLLSFESKARTSVTLVSWQMSFIALMCSLSDRSPSSSRSWIADRFRSGEVVTPEELKALAKAKTDEATWAIAWPLEVFWDGFGHFVEAASSKESSAERLHPFEGRGIKGIADKGNDSSPKLELQIVEAFNSSQDILMHEMQKTHLGWLSLCCLKVLWWL